MLTSEKASPEDLVGVDLVEFDELVLPVRSGRFELLEPPPGGPLTLDLPASVPLSLPTLDPGFAPVEFAPEFVDVESEGEFTFPGPAGFDGIEPLPGMPEGGLRVEFEFAPPNPLLLPFGELPIGDVGTRFGEPFGGPLCPKLLGTGFEVVVDGVFEFTELVFLGGLEPNWLELGTEPWFGVIGVGLEFCATVELLEPPEDVVA